MAMAGADVDSYAKEIANLAGLARPSEVGVANRVLKYSANPSEAEQAGLAPEEVAAKAVAFAGERDRLSPSPPVIYIAASVNHVTMRRPASDSKFWPL